MLPLQWLPGCWDSIVKKVDTALLSQGSGCRGDCRPGSSHDQWEVTMETCKALRAITGGASSSRGSEKVFLVGERVGWEALCLSRVSNAGMSISCGGQGS